MWTPQFDKSLVEREGSNPMDYLFDTILTTTYLGKFFNFPNYGDKLFIRILNFVVFLILLLPKIAVVLIVVMFIIMILCPLDFAIHSFGRICYLWWKKELK